MYNNSDYYQKMLTYPASPDTQIAGKLQVQCLTARYMPLENVSVSIAAAAAPGKAIYEGVTDQSGLTDYIPLPAPAVEHSLDSACAQQPYSNYNITIIAGGYPPIHVNNIAIFPGVTALQSITFDNSYPDNSCPLYTISPHTLYGDYPAKIKESETKDLEGPETSRNSKVVIPEFILVHDGHPMDSSVPNYYVRFQDYIKNVVSSEIYPTWPESTIYAHTLAIISFTLNRMYTDWYRKKGYDFTVTSATDYDHKWINGRNIYKNISLAVDDVFLNYLSRPEVTQPLLTPSCNPARSTYPNAIPKWRSKELGERGYSTIQILNHYLGEDLYINKADTISGIQNPWPGNNLLTGCFNKHVKTMQKQLNRIALNFTAIPRLATNGNYDCKTAYAVRIFQTIFHLPDTGIIDITTWYKISSIFAMISKIEEYMLIYL